MTTDEHEQRDYLEQTYRKSPEGSARRIWAAAQLAKLQPPSAAQRRVSRDQLPSAAWRRPTPCKE